MRISRRRHQDDHSYTMSDTILDKTREFTYLGIIIQDDLCWNKQTHHAVTKATRVLNFIKRNFYMCSKNVKEKLYLTLVRPHLEYGVAAWNPHMKCQQSSLEMVQRRAARFVQGDYRRTSSVSEMLNSLQWENLTDRRETHQMTQLYKIINQDIQIDSSGHLKAKSQRSRRGNNVQFEMPQITSSVFSNSFFPRTVRTWNDLPQEIIVSKTHETFRGKYFENLISENTNV